MGRFWFHEEGKGAGCADFMGSGEGGWLRADANWAGQKRKLKRPVNSTRCYTMSMKDRAGGSARIFKTAWFSKAAQKAHIWDAELCSAIRQVMLGQADDLGGGVFKKRLGKNLYRSIVVARGGRYWVYTYLFAKKDRANIGDNELMDFRALAALYARKTDADIAKELELRELMEICHDNESQVQE
jgi:hypothetical protein